MLEPLGRRELGHRRPTDLQRFLYGACYYPEHWEEPVRAGDAALMRAAGMNAVRMGEFAWDRFEPAVGAFDFSLFDETIERLGEEGIATILCTPTATPPRWLTQAHPEMLRVDGNGIRLQHGSRQHCCHANELFRQHSRRITQALADHFAGNGRVVGWQTDNEFHCHFSECHCPACQEGFRSFLREKYGGDIAALNRAWGTAFWALTFSSFEEVTTPLKGRPALPNPAQLLDYYRYLAGAVALFQHEQVEILRRANRDWFVFHNGLFGHVDYRGLFTQDLDMIAYDAYPQFDVNSATRSATQAFNLDRARSWSGNFIVPEQQSGPGGSGDYFHDHPEPGEIRRMFYTTMARGADSILFFRWRTCRFGAEEYWCGVLDHDGVPRRRYRETAAIGKELEAVGAEVLGTRVRVEAALATGDMDNADAHGTMSLGLPHPNEVAERLHNWLYREGYAVGCVHPADDLSGIALYIVPHWVIVDPTWLPHLKAYVENGGVLVIGARTGTRDLNNNVIGETPPGLLRGLCGASVEEYGRQNDVGNRRLRLAVEEREATSDLWYEMLTLEGAEPLAQWRDRHLRGTPAVSVRKLGAGRVIYVGTYFTGPVIDLLMPVLAEMSGLQKLWPTTPEGMSVSVREDGEKELWFFINTTDGELAMGRVPEGVDLLTGEKTSGALMLAGNELAIVRMVK